MDKRIMGLGAIILLFVILFMVIPTNTPPPIPTPVVPTFVPQPTVPQMTKLKVLGGLTMVDPLVITTLKEEYLIDADETMTGSFDQAVNVTENVDCTIPAGDGAVDYYTSLHPKGKPLAAKDVVPVYSTPLVLYTWRQNLSKFLASGLVKTTDGKHYTVKMAPIIDAMVHDKSWKSLGVDLPGNVSDAYSITSTDPMKSSSGFVFMTLIADYLTPGGQDGGTVATIETIDQGLPAIRKYWLNAGRQATDSPGLFNRFLQASPQGMPVTVNYEQAFLEYYAGLTDPAQKTRANEAIVGIYPEVTINTVHYIIKVSDNCQKLIDAFKSEKLTKLAWERHGLRNRIGQPGDPIVDWVSESYRSMGEPKYNVVAAIREVLK